MTRYDIEDFNYRYAECLDENRILDWPKFFTDTAIYRITSRENYDLGLSGGILYASGIGMINDRAKAIAETQYFAPRYLMHLTSNTRIKQVNTEEKTVEAVSNFLLVETLIDEHSKLHLSGRYVDTFVVTGQGLLLQRRDVVYDSNCINSALIYPI